MTTRRLLVITYHHPPDGAIGGMRWAGFTRYLGELGWRSWLITAAAPGGNSCHPGVTQIPTPRRGTLNDLYKRLKQEVAKSNGNGRGNGRGGRTDRQARPPGWLARLKFEAGMLLVLPDDARGWILRAALRARREVARVRPDVVISSGPPHSAHLVAWLATRGTGTRWLVDLRDPWAGPVTDAWRSSPMYRSGLARWLLPRLERLVIRSADGVLCNTREFAAALSDRYGDATVDWIPNGVDMASLPATRDEPFAGLGIAYAGTLYGGRSLEPILQALRLFLGRHPQAAEDGTRFRLAGHIDPAHAPRLSAEVAALGLSGHVEHVGVLAREAALRLAARSRLAVVLAQEQQLQVPAKLYELVAMGVPTLVVGERESAAASEARRLGAIAVEPDAVPKIARVLAEAWEGLAAPPNREATLLDYRDLCQALDAVLSRNCHAVR
jgi:hypothetical protein